MGKSVEHADAETNATERHLYRFPLSQESLEYMGWVMCVGMFDTKVGCI